MVGCADGRDVSVTAVSVLGPLLALQTLRALNGLDATLLDGGDDFTIEPSQTRYIEASWAETVIRGRPWVPHKRVATVHRGTRLVVRGEVDSRDDAGCDGKPWYAVLPFGYVCSKHARPTDEAPDPGPALPLPDGKRVPHSYALVRSDGVPQYASAEMAQMGVAEAELTKGMSLVVRRAVDIAGFSYVETRDGKLVPKDDVGWMGQGSEWRGVRIEDASEGPLFAWNRKAQTVVFEAPSSDAATVGELKPRERVMLYEQQGMFRRVGPSMWVQTDHLNEVIIRKPPPDVLTEFRLSTVGNDQWFDVDVGEQVLVAYRGETPVYATLVSSGRGSPTPLGNYPVWAKVASMDMANQDYEDRPYMVQGVPYVLLFQGHNALHGAYWHDRFGNRKSHGCVNLAPLDAHHLFQWTGPSLPAGWTGYLPYDLHQAPVVHVRDSSRSEEMQFTQSRPWGPPDREEERAKLEAAEQRRALAEAAADPEEPDPLEPTVPQRIRPPLGGLVPL